mmetsp:Transcript_14972/g.30883  ORF Transcript_14972/g.30883 Transcript_14972/m.30883 type:complete len:238 (+) Transcript_14972:333-1046(+)
MGTSMIAWRMISLPSRNFRNMLCSVFSYSEDTVTYREFVDIFLIKVRTEFSRTALMRFLSSSSSLFLVPSQQQLLPAVIILLWPVDWRHYSSSRSPIISIKLRMAVFLCKACKPLRGNGGRLAFSASTGRYASVEGFQKDAKLRSVALGVEVFQGSNQTWGDQSLPAGLVPECHRHVAPGPAGRKAGPDDLQQVHDRGRVAFRQAVFVVGQVVVDTEPVGEALIGDYGFAFVVGVCC